MINENKTNANLLLSELKSTQQAKVVKDCMKVTLWDACGNEIIVSRTHTDLGIRIQADEPVLSLEFIEDLLLIYKEWNVD
ncbi:hypothetical protein KAR91_01190 [Candidatus Pacearchaeota archaeon]|nr:hypothetical protein [Candidatus Pacearchaeota archaeon]